jgi:hypothetical protein
MKQFEGQERPHSNNTKALLAEEAIRGTITPALEQFGSVEGPNEAIRGTRAPALE